MWELAQNHYEVCTRWWYPQSEIYTASGNSRRLRRNINKVLGENANAGPALYAADYRDMDDDKVADTRSATASADQTTFAVNSSFRWRSQLRSCFAVETVGLRPTNQQGLWKNVCRCPLNSSLVAGWFPAVRKNAIVKPPSMKSSLDEADPSNYTPATSLHFCRRLWNALVLRQLTTFPETLICGLRCSPHVQKAAFDWNGDPSSLFWPVRRHRIKSSLCCHRSTYQPLLPWKTTMIDVCRRSREMEGSFVEVPC